MEKFKLNHIYAGYLTLLLVLTGTFVSWKLATLYFIGIHLLVDRIHDTYKPKIPDEDLSRGQDKFISG